MVGRRGDGGKGEAEDDTAATGGPVLGPDVPLVGLNDAFTDGQPEPGARGAAAAPTLGAPEAFEDALELFGRDANALILDGDDHRAARHTGGRNQAGLIGAGEAGADTNAGAGRAVLERIVDEVVEHLLDAGGIDQNRRDARGEGNVDRVAAEQGLQAVEGGVNELDNAARLALEAQR